MAAPVLARVQEAFASIAERIDLSPRLLAVVEPR